MHRFLFAALPVILAAALSAAEPTAPTTTTAPTHMTVRGTFVFGDDFAPLDASDADFDDAVAKIGAGAGGFDVHEGEGNVAQGLGEGKQSRRTIRSPIPGQQRRKCRPRDMVLALA